tara:strand:+ start:629 stop:1120 length:492 start_codon:yes stop_codon:yes gene_type:complete
MISDLSKIKKIRSKKKFTISLAESCTGGMISKYLTSINGSSLFFNGACITYSNKMKTSLLRVPKNTIINYGAVSHQTALAMVRGLKRITDSEILLSVTGVAGPSGGTLRTPVGCVFFGIGSKINKKYTFQTTKKIFRGKTRLAIQKNSTEHAMHLILKELKKI